MDTIRIATRQSKLALWQAEYVAQQLRTHYPDLDVTLVPIKTEGDKILDQPLAKIGGKGLFIKELELAMLEGKADIAVHSMKDVGVVLPDEFVLACIMERETPYDAFVSTQYKTFAELPKNARIGTCSLRRRMNLSFIRPDLQLLDLRGNLQTRLVKLDEGQFEAIILASAGLKRLGLDKRIQQTLPPSLSLPAIGQGAIGIECHHQNKAILKRLKPLNHADTALCVRTERIINERLEGSCQVPIAAFATLNDGVIEMTCRVGTPDGKQILTAQGKAPREQAQQLGNDLADELVNKGAQNVLNQVLSGA